MQNKNQRPGEGQGRPNMEDELKAGQVRYVAEQQSELDKAKKSADDINYRRTLMFCPVIKQACFGSSGYAQGEGGNKYTCGCAAYKRAQVTRNEENRKWEVVGGYCTHSAVGELDDILQLGEED